MPALAENRPPARLPDILPAKRRSLGPLSPPRKPGAPARRDSAPVPPAARPTESDLASSPAARGALGALARGAPLCVLTAHLAEPEAPRAPPSQVSPVRLGRGLGPKPARPSPAPPARRARRMSAPAPARRAVTPEEAAARRLRHAAAARIQRRWQAARRPAVDEVLLAMPGTLQGTSGWYRRGGVFAFFDFEGGRWRMRAGPFTRAAWDELRAASKTSRVMLACPGTEQGASGFYMNNSGLISHWTVDGDDWQPCKDRGALPSPFAPPAIAVDMSCAPSSPQPQTSPTARVLGGYSLGEYCLDPSLSSSLE